MLMKYGILKVSLVGTSIQGKVMMTQTMQTVNTTLIEIKKSDWLHLNQGNATASFGEIISSEMSDMVQKFETVDHTVTVEENRFMVLSKGTQPNWFFVVHSSALGGYKVFYESGGVFGKWLQFDEGGYLCLLDDQHGQVRV
jgi:hypothetical protein